MVVLHTVGLDPGGGALRATLQVTQTPRLASTQSSTREQLRGITIAALIPRSRLDNFGGGERIDPNRRRFD